MLYVAGYTTSPDFDVVNAAQPTFGGGTDGWVAQILLNLTITSFVPPEGIINTSVGFATYLGGSGTDEITGLTIDQNTKDVFVTGLTKSTNFPVTQGSPPGHAFRNRRRLCRSLRFGMHSQLL